MTTGGNVTVRDLTSPQSTTRQHSAIARTGPLGCPRWMLHQRMHLSCGCLARSPIVSCDWSLACRRHRARWSS